MAYERDLAEIHHLHYDDVASAAAGEIIDRLAAGGQRSGLIVDLGCGSGVTAAELLAAGYDVFGVDISPEMIRLATETAPAGSFVCRSLFDIDLPACVAVSAVSEAINYAFDDRSSSTELAALFARIHAALVSGGIFVFDIATPDRIGPGETRHLRRDGDDWSIFVAAVGSEDGRTLTRDITVFRRDGDLWRRSDETHVQRLHHGEEIRGLLEAAGFDVAELEAYRSKPFPPGLAGFVATAD